MSHFVVISNIYIFYTDFFSYNIFRFTNEKYFLQLFDFFRIFSSQVSNLEDMHFFSDSLSRDFLF